MIHPSLPPKAGQNKSVKKVSDNKLTTKEAFKYLAQGNKDKAAKIMMKLASSGNRIAQFHLGEFYLHGTGVDENLEKAKYWLTKSSNNGYNRATDKLEELNSNSEVSGGFCGCIVMIFVGLSLVNWISSLF